MPWFDAHLDLAYLAQRGRDMHATTHDINAGRATAGAHTPAGVTLADLASAGIAGALGTIFTEAVPPSATPLEPQQYRAGDWNAARNAGLWQLHWYAQNASKLPPNLGILIECADVVAGVDDLPLWHDQGVVALGLTWVGQGRYAGGNATQTGLTTEGLDLVRHIDALGIVHDASHLSDASFWQLCNATTRAIIATHSNCRSLLGGGATGENQRHLSDEQIREIARRDGVIGLNLFSAFLDPDKRLLGRATIADCTRHIEHVCSITNSRRHVALGSDTDGGFPADRLPQGINSPADWHKLTDALAAIGWSDADLAGFQSQNWARVLHLS